MKNLTSKSEKKFQRVMHEFGQGELKSHDKKVTDQKQALAIAFSEARKVYPNYGMMKKAGEIKEPIAVKGLFSLDAIEDKTFKGYTFWDDWNGWATPYFESEEANEIGHALGGKKGYDKPPYFMFPEEGPGSDLSDGPYEQEKIQTVDGEKMVYPIGAYNWTWNNDLLKNGGEVKRSSAGNKEGWHFVVRPNFTSALYKTKKEAEDKLDEYLETGKFDFYGTAEMHDGGSVGERAAVLAKIYKEGTAKQLWEAWTPENRVHFLLDHAVEFFELMGDNYTKSFNGFAVLSYDALPSTIKKSVLIHHAQGMYRTGGSIASRFWNTTKKHSKSAYEKSKELAGKGYEKTKEGLRSAKAYTEKKIHDQKRDIALGVLDETRGKANTKDQSRILNAASNLVEDQYADGAGIEEPLQKLSPGASMAEGGGADEGVDLFEDYENIPPKVQKILDKYEQGISDGDYDELKKAKDALEEIGYTFEYYLDGQAYDLRKIGEKGKVEVAEEKKQDEKYKNESEEVKTARKISMKHFDGLEEGEDVKYKDVTFRKTGNELIHLSDDQMAGGGGIPGGAKGGRFKFEIGDKVMVDDTGYVKKFEGFDLTKPATIRDRNKSKSGGKTYYFYKLEMANGDKPFNQAEEDTLTPATMAGGGEVLAEKRRVIKKLMSDENFLTNLSIKQSVAFMDRIDRAKSKKEINELIGNAQKLKRMNEGGEITSPRDIPYNEVLDYADEKALNTETEGNFKEAAMMLFKEKYGKKSSKLSPAKKKLLDRINTLKATKANAGAAAQKAIQKKIDVLQKQFDYNPSAKERAMANKGKFALDVPAKYSKAIYKKLWSIKVFPKIHTLNGTSSIVVSSKLNLDKAYTIFSDMLKEKGENVPSLAKISRKL